MSRNDLEQFASHQVGRNIVNLTSVAQTVSQNLEDAATQHELILQVLRLLDQVLTGHDTDVPPEVIEELRGIYREQPYAISRAFNIAAEANDRRAQVTL